MTPTSEPLDDLRHVVRNLKTTHHQRERDPNDPRVVEILESAVDVLAHFYLRSEEPHAAAEDDSAQCESGDRKIMTTVFSPVTRQAVINRFNERQTSSESGAALPQLTARNLDSLWSGAAPFQHDVLNYLYRPSVHKRFLTRLADTLASVIDEATFGQALRALGNTTAESPELQVLRIQVLLPVLFSNNSYIRDLSKSCFETHHSAGLYLSKVIFDAYQVEFSTGRTPRDLHLALEVLAKSVFLMHQGTGQWSRADNGMDVHQQLIFDAIRCNLRVPLKEALSSKAADGSAIVQKRLHGDWYNAVVQA